MDQGSQAVQQLKRRESDHGPAVVRGPRQPVEDHAVLAYPPGVLPHDPVQGEGRPGAAPEQSLQARPVVGGDADRGVQGEAPGVIPAEHLVDRVLLEEPLPAEPAEDASSDRLLEGLDVGPGEARGLVEPDAP